MERHGMDGKMPKGLQRPKTIEVEVRMARRIFGKDSDEATPSRLSVDIDLRQE